MVVCREAILGKGLIIKRKYPIGAECQPEGGVDFRVWAPAAGRVRVFLEAGPGSPAEVDLQGETGGYFSVFHPSAAAGTIYRFQLDEHENRLPDPASRFQPDGPHGASAVVNPSMFSWTDSAWRGVKLEGQIL